LLMALAQHAPARFTWSQLARNPCRSQAEWRTFQFNAGRKHLRDAGYVAETSDVVMIMEAGLAAAGEVPALPSTPAERLALWCDRLPSPAPEMLRTLAAEGERYGGGARGGGARQETEQRALEFGDRLFCATMG
jgi:hypothetical protein